MFQSCPDRSPASPIPTVTHTPGVLTLEEGWLWPTLRKARISCVYIRYFFQKFSINTALWEIFLLKHFGLFFFFFNLMTSLNGSQKEKKTANTQGMFLSACVVFRCFWGGNLLRSLETLRRPEGVERNVALQLVRSFFRI